MPNEVAEELDFAQSIDKVPDRVLIEFTARKIHQMCTICDIHTQDIEDLKNRDRRTFNIAGGVGGGVAGALVIIVQYILGIFNR